MIATTTLLLCAAQMPAFLENPVTGDHSPNAYFVMDTSIHPGPYEYRLNSSNPNAWVAFDATSGSTTKLVLTSGDIEISNQHPDFNGVNKIDVRIVGSSPPFLSYLWSINLTAFEDGTDTRAVSNDPRTWHVLSPSEIATVDDEPLARLGFRDSNGDIVGFEKAGKMNNFRRNRTFFLATSGTGTGLLLDDPADYQTFDYDTLLHSDRLVFLPGDYTNTQRFHFVNDVPSSPVLQDLEILAVQDVRIIQEDQEIAVLFEEINSTLFQGFEVDAFEHSETSPGEYPRVHTVLFKASNNNQIDSCVIHSGNGLGITISDASQPSVSDTIQVTNCEIYDMYLEGEDRHGILIGPEAQDIYLKGNHIYHNSGDAIQVVCEARNIPPVADLASFANTVIIEGNRMHNDNENAVDVWSSVGVEIRDNLMYGYSLETAGAFFSPAIKMHHGVTDAVIEYNQISYSKQGINITNGDEADYELNVLVQGWDNDESQHYPERVTVRRNLIIDGEAVNPIQPAGDTTGIVVSECQEIHIVNNEVRNFDKLADVNYDIIGSERLLVPPIESPNAGYFMNNLFVGAQAQPPAVSVALYDQAAAAPPNPRWGTWDTDGDGTLAPSVFISSTAGVESEMRLRIDPVALTTFYQDTISAIEAIRTPPVTWPFQSGIEANTSVFPMDLADWWLVVIPNLADPPNPIGLVGTGVHIATITDDARFGQGLLKNIGIY